MKTTENAHKDHAADACRSAEVKGSAPSSASAASSTSKGAVFRISTMDCAAEESEIRRALEPISGVRGLGFQLGARTLTIDAPESAIPEALAAIRKAGFNPEPVAPAQSDDHGSTADGLWRMVLALALAIAAETLSFFAPDTTVFKGIGMVVEHVRRRMGHQRQCQRGQRPWPGQLAPRRGRRGHADQAAHKSDH